jgi:hypothetical protein
MNTIIYDDYKFEIEITGSQINITLTETNLFGDVYQVSINEANIYVKTIKNLVLIVERALNREPNYNLLITDKKGQLICSFSYSTDIIDIEEKITFTKVNSEKTNELNIKELTSRVEVLTKQYKELNKSYTLIKLLLMILLLMILLLVILLLVKLSPMTTSFKEQNLMINPQSISPMTTSFEEQNFMINPQSISPMTTLTMTTSFWKVLLLKRSSLDTLSLVPLLLMPLLLVLSFIRLSLVKLSLVIGGRLSLLTLSLLTLSLMMLSLVILSSGRLSLVLLFFVQLLLIKLIF